jgi:hypothetical protein
LHGTSVGREEKQKKENKVRSKIIAILLSLVGSLVLAGHAGVISINFNNGVDFIDTNQFESVSGNTDWVELLVSTVSDTFVDYTDIGGYGIDLSIDSGNGRAANSAWDGWAQEVGFRTKDGDVIRCDMSNIPYDEYKIIAYVGNLTSPQDAYISIGTNSASAQITYYYSSSTLSTVPSLVRNADTDDSDGIDSGSYVVFGSDEDPLTGPEQVIKLIAGNVGVSMFCAMEIVPVGASIPEVPDEVSINFNNTTDFIDSNQFESISGNTDWIEVAAAVASDEFVYYQNVGNSGIYLSIDSGNGRVKSGDASWDGWPQEVGFRTKDGDLIQCNINHIPYDEYKIIAYVGNYDSPQDAYIYLESGGSTNYYSSSALSGSLVQCTDTNSSDGIDTGNYVVFGSNESPLTGFSQVLRLIAGSAGVSMLCAIEIIPAADPLVLGDVDISLNDTDLVFSWVGQSHGTYTLQSRTNLVGGNWSNIIDGISGLDGTVYITNSINGAAVFYRIVGE